MKIVRDVSLKNSRKVMVSLTWWSVLLYGIVLEEQFAEISTCVQQAHPPPPQLPPPRPKLTHVHKLKKYKMGM